MPRQALMIALLLMLTVPAAAVEKSDRKTDASPRSGREYRSRSDYGRFNSADRNLIRSWLLEAKRRETAGHLSAGLPPGLQGNVTRGKPLPPGWQKKIVRGEPLDPDFYLWGTTLPNDLLRRLPPPPPGSEIFRIEDTIIRIDIATRIILDVFELGGY